MAGFLVSDIISNVYQKVMFWKDNIIQTTSADGSSDVTINNIANDLTMSGDITLTGAVTTSTQAADDNSTKLATTAYVETAVDAKDNLGELSGTLDDIADGASYIKLSNADKTKLDGIDSSADVNRTMDANPTDGNTANSVSSNGVFDALATKLDLSGGTMTDALTMSSGDKLQFVDANEYISGDGTDLTIGSGGKVVINPAGGQVIIEDDDVAEPVLEIKSTADASGAGGLKFTKDRGSAGTDGDNIGIINWNAKSSDNTEHLYAQIWGMATETDASNEEGRLKLNVTTSHSVSGSITTTGLQLDGTTTDGQVDATVGAGTGSTTAVAGNLTAVGTINGVTFTDVASLKSALSLNNVSNDAQMPLAGGIFTGPVTAAGNPTNDLHIAPKQYVDARKETNIISNPFYFSSNTSLRTYFRDSNDASQMFNLNVYDSEYETTVGDTITIINQHVVSGYVMPEACTLKSVAWNTYQEYNVSGRAIFQVWTIDDPENSNVATLRTTEVITSNRQVFNSDQSSGLALSSGAVVIPAIRFVSGASSVWYGSYSILLEKEVT